MPSFRIMRFWIFVLFFSTCLGENYYVSVMSGSEVSISCNQSNPCFNIQQAISVFLNTNGSTFDVYIDGGTYEGPGNANFTLPNAMTSLQPWGDATVLFKAAEYLYVFTASASVNVTNITFSDFINGMLLWAEPETPKPLLSLYSTTFLGSAAANINTDGANFYATHCSFSSDIYISDGNSTMTNCSINNASFLGYGEYATFLMSGCTFTDSYVIVNPSGVSPFDVIVEYSSFYSSDESQDSLIQVSGGDVTLSHVTVYGLYIYNVIYVENVDSFVMSNVTLDISLNEGIVDIAGVNSPYIIRDCSFHSVSLQISSAVASGIIEDCKFSHCSRPIYTTEDFLMARCMFNYSGSIQGGGTYGMISDCVFQNSWNVVNLNGGSWTLNNCSVFSVSPKLFSEQYNMVEVNNEGQFNITISNSSFIGNYMVEAFRGSDINAVSLNIPNANILVENSYFANNGASSVGGGLNIFSGGSAIVRNCIFENNYVPNVGGAIAIGSIGNITISGCNFKNNTALNAGGSIYFGPSNSFNATIENCSFSDSYQSAVFIDASGSIVVFDNVEFSNNYPYAINCHSSDSGINSVIQYASVDSITINGETDDTDSIQRTNCDIQGGPSKTKLIIAVSIAGAALFLVVVVIGFYVWKLRKPKVSEYDIQ